MMLIEQLQNLEITILLKHLNFPFSQSSFKKILLSTMTSIPPLVFQPIQFSYLALNLPYHG